MTGFMCDQSVICPDECVGCGGWLHAVRRGGFPGPAGTYCAEDCAADASEARVRADTGNHLRLRDLLCECPEVCAPRGLPSAEMRAEYAAYCADHILRGTS